MLNVRLDSPLNIQHSPSSPFTPRAQPGVERFEVRGSNEEVRSLLHSSFAARTSHLADETWAVAFNIQHSTFNIPRLLPLLPARRPRLTRRGLSQRVERFEVRISNE